MTDDPRQRVSSASTWEGTAMAKFVYVYTGGQAASTPQEQEAVLGKWMAWFGELGSAVKDAGNAFGPSATVRADGEVLGTGGKATGYSIVEADSLESATRLAKGSPILHDGGSVVVYEALEM
jgi:hypothetical protein